MHITCEHCQAAITIDDLAVFQREGVTCPICNTFHFVTAGRKTPFDPPGSTTMMYSDGSTRTSAKIIRRQRKP